MKNNMMQISVITPVYNAAKFITRAVESALAQPETGEILLIEDASPDNSLQLCQELASKYDKVKVLQHPDKGNHGAGASRNLGMKKAKFEYIGFVDADNFFMPDRFVKTKQVFGKYPECEGVYEAIGIHVENETALKRWLDSNRFPPDQLITLSTHVEPEDLGEALISGKYGYLTLDGFVIKQSVLEKVGFMAEHLRLHQDTEWITRCALSAMLLPGNMEEAVAMEGVHESNRFSAPRPLSEEYNNRMNFWISLYHWAKINSTKEIQNLIRQRIIYYTKSHKYIQKFPRERFPARIIRFFRLIRLLGYPEIILDSIKLKLLKN